jgi:hypothetical protein
MSTGGSSETVRLSSGPEAEVCRIMACYQQIWQPLTEELRCCDVWSLGRRGMTAPTAHAHRTFDPRTQ